MIVYVTYTGTVSSGYDQTGVFGPPNTLLTGDPYTALIRSIPPKGLPTEVPTTITL